MIKFLDKEKREERKKICDSCKYKKGALCSKCGCFLIAKQKVEKWKCPEGKF